MNDDAELARALSLAGPQFPSRHCRSNLTPISASSCPHALDESAGLQSPGPFTGISDFLKNSASSSAPPFLRVEIHSLDPSTFRLPCAPPPNLPHSMNDDAELAQPIEN